MTADQVQERFAPDAPFRFVGGDTALDFVNTADWTERGLERDRFTAYDRLLEWARGANVLGVADARRLTQLAAKHPRRSALALERAREVRDVLRSVFSSIILGKPGANELERLNALMADAVPQMRLVRGAAGRLVRGWAGLGEALHSLTWPVIWSAAELASSGDVDRLRMCGGRDCGWMYVDRSRNGLRRWCEMGVCGTTEKNRRRAGTRME